MMGDDFPEIYTYRKTQRLCHPAKDLFKYSFLMEAIMDSFKNDKEDAVSIETVSSLKHKNSP